MIIIRTAPRPGDADYITDLLEACEREGFGGEIVEDNHFISQVPAHPSRWSYYVTGRSLGSREAGWAALRRIVYHDADALLLEDDARPVPGAVAAMLETPVPEWAAFVSYFSYQKSLPPGHLLKLDSAAFVGSVAIKVPLETARKVLADYPVPPDERHWTPRHCFDSAFGAACAFAVRSSYALVQPSLVEHVGNVSIVSARRRPKRAAWLEGSR